MSIHVRTHVVVIASYVYTHMCICEIREGVAYRSSGGSKFTAVRVPRRVRERFEHVALFGQTTYAWTQAVPLYACYYLCLRKAQTT